VIVVFHRLYSFQAGDAMALTPILIVPEILGVTEKNSVSHVSQNVVHFSIIEEAQSPTALSTQMCFISP